MDKAQKEASVRQKELWTKKNTEGKGERVSTHFPDCIYSIKEGALIQF